MKNPDLATTRGQLEVIRNQAKQNFDKVRGTWIECGQWTIPHRVQWLLSQTPGERNNRHIVDPTHVVALRSYVAGFLEGNTSASRPWYNVLASDPEKNEIPNVRAWLQKFTHATQRVLTNSNFYYAAGQFYYDYGVFNTGSYYIDENEKRLYFHNLVPGSYYVINNGYGDAVILVREFQLTVKALVDHYGKDGKWDNFSSNVKKSYQDGNYMQLIDVVHIIKENTSFDPNQPGAGLNRKWIAFTYEAGGQRGPSYQNEISPGSFSTTAQTDEEKRYLRVKAFSRKPFVVGKSETNGNFEYGMKGPTADALGLIRSLNKKAIAKDQAIEMMLRPPLQGPANLRKSYIASASNTFVPLDPQSTKPGGGMRTVFEINPAIGSVIQDQNDLRQLVGKLYYSDYLLYLSQNPRTRTAAETNAIVQEQQLVIGPNLQSLNYSHNIPVVEFVMDFTLDNDDTLEPPPDEIAGSFLRAEFVSVFAQAMKAADLPSVERYIQKMMEVGQIDPTALQKVNFDKLADIYEDRLFLPTGLNRGQDEVDKKREQAQAMQQRQMQMEQLQQASQAAKNVGMNAQQLGLTGGGDQPPPQQ